MSQEHAPTQQKRQHVEMLAAIGIPQASIAAMLEISVPTLKAHYGAELEIGKDKMLAQVGATLFQQAVGRPARFDEHGNKVQTELKPNTACAMFIMKCRAGWKETQVVEHIDPTAGAIERLEAEIDRVIAASAEPGALELAQDADPGRPH